MKVWGIEPRGTKRRGRGEGRDESLATPCLSLHAIGCTASLRPRLDGATMRDWCASLCRTKPIRTIFTHLHFSWRLLACSVHACPGPSSSSALQDSVHIRRGTAVGRGRAGGAQVLKQLSTKNKAPQDRPPNGRTIHTTSRPVGSWSERQLRASTNSISGPLYVAFPLHVAVPPGRFDHHRASHGSTKVPPVEKKTQPPPQPLANLTNTLL